MLEGKNFRLSSSAAILIGSVVIALAILIAGGTISLPGIKKDQTNNQPAPQATLSPTPAPPIKPVSENDHLKGKKDAKVMMVEYSDLECPFCKKFHQAALQAMGSYKADELAWVFRHFPLDQLHSKARKESEATECAKDLGGEEVFWKMLDKIYEVTPSNNGLNLDDLPKLASQANLDSAKFKTCLDSGKYADKVENYIQEAIKAGIQGTPTVFLLNTKTGKFTPVPRAVFYEDLKTAIDALLKP